MLLRLESYRYPYLKGATCTYQLGTRNQTGLPETEMRSGLRNAMPERNTPRRCSRAVCVWLPGVVLGLFAMVSGLDAGKQAAPEHLAPRSIQFGALQR